MGLIRLVRMFRGGLIRDVITKSEKSVIMKLKLPKVNVWTIFRAFNAEGSANSIWVYF